MTTHNVYLYQSGDRVSLVAALSDDSSLESGNLGTVAEVRGNQPPSEATADQPAPGQPAPGQPAPDEAASDAQGIDQQGIDEQGMAQVRLEVIWDRGGRTVVRADQVQPHVAADRWTRTATAVAAAGTRRGQQVAPQWLAETIGDFAPHPGTRRERRRHTAREARRLLGALALGQRSLLDRLPTVGDLTGFDASIQAPGWYTAAVGDRGPAWRLLTADDRSALRRVYTAKFDEALRDRIAETCRVLAGPTGDDRALAHLDPAGLTVGGTAIFSNRWYFIDPDLPGDTPTDGATTDDGTGLRGLAHYSEGYVGVLLEETDDGAVFDCDRSTAEAIVAAQQARRAKTRSGLAATGLNTAAVDRAVDSVAAGMFWDSDVIVVDERARTGDSIAARRIHPDADGRYRMPDWGWYAVDPYACDRIHGPLPAPAGQLGWVPLQHLPAVRLTDDRLRARPLMLAQIRADSLSVLGLEQDGNPVAIIEAADDLNVEFLDPDLDEEYLRRYAAGSTFNGTPLTVDELLQTLVTEAETTALLAEKTAENATLARYVDAAGLHLLTGLAVWPAPRTTYAALHLGRQLTDAAEVQDPGVTDDGTGRWELWTGTAWLDVTPYPNDSDSESGPFPAWVTHPISEIPPLQTPQNLSRDQLVTLAADHGVLLPAKGDLTALAARIATVLHLDTEPGAIPDA